MQHAKASPSGYKRWMSCPGSITLESNLGDLLAADDSSPAATLGTELHATAERALKGECEPCELTQFYVDFCREAAAPDESEMLIEARVPLFYSPDEHGYADCVVRTDDVVHVIDLKTGNIPVSAKDNFQLFIYAYGMGLTSTETFRMTIIQDNEAKTWEINEEQADALASVIRVRAQAAMNDYVRELVPSDDACRWCRCKPYCKAYTSQLLNNMVDLTGGMSRLSDDAMTYLFANSKQIRATLNEIEAALYSRVSGGEQIAGVTIANGRRGAKTWRDGVDPVTVMAQAGIPVDQAVVSKPISPTQAMKLADIDEETYMQPDGKPKLVPGEVFDPMEYFVDV